MIDLEPLNAAVVALLDGTDPAAPTGCGDWSVADLARHLVAGERAFTIAVGGTAYDLAAITTEVATIADGDVGLAYDVASAALREALAAAPADVLVPSPLGEVLPAVVGEIRAMEAVAHGWDLAGALGRVPSYAVDLEPLVGAADRMRAALDVARPGNTAFGPAYDVAADAPALHRVLARLGRRP